MSHTIDTVVSVVFVFLTFSLVVSAAREVVAAWLRLRSRTLKNGLDTLLKSLGDDTLVECFWGHCFVRSMQPSGKSPSYIPASTVAATLLHLADGNRAGVPVDLDNLKGKLPGLAHRDLATLLFFIIGQSGSSATLADVQSNLEKWIDSAMERFSSLYQRNTRLWLFVVSLCSAGVLNVDTITICQRIYGDNHLRNQLVASASESILQGSRIDESLRRRGIPEPKFNGYPAGKVGGETQRDSSASLGATNVEVAEFRTVPHNEHLEAFQTLGLPIGWTTENTALYDGFWSVLLHSFGILASAFAASIGAPFWFDILKRFMNIRSALRSSDKMSPSGSAL